MKHTWRRIAVGVALAAAAATGALTLDTIVTPQMDTGWGAPAIPGDTGWGTPPASTTPVTTLASPSDTGWGA